MTPIQYAIHKPVTVMVGVILVALFGVLAALALPVQLTPNVDKPLVTIQTRWEGASPQEIEQEIINEQEDKLKSIQGLHKMTSSAVEGSGTIELEFLVGVDLNRALLDASDKLRQVQEYPENVDEPVLRAGETRGESAIAWFILMRTEDSDLDPNELPKLRTLMEEVVKPRLERADGVASVGIVGGIDREVHIEVDPQRLAARGLNLLDVRDAIRRRNVDVSAGNMEEGKRAYIVRTVGRFESIAQIESLLLARRDGQPVYLRDVGHASLGYKERTSVVRSLGYPAICVNAIRQGGSNVIKVMASLKENIGAVNEDILRRRGLKLVQVYDQTDYIYSAIQLVVQNLYVGGSLTILVLLIFLRSWRSIAVLGLAIPISVIGSFLLLRAFDRNFNVISLAGLAFAVGMVVDNSIVVLENIYRHREQGEGPVQAAWKGATEVWGAVLASTLTTLAVFVPVVFIQEEAGQLFRDIAIAISASVFLSLIVSVYFIPMASARFLGDLGKKKKPEPNDKPSRRLGLSAFGGAAVRGITGLVEFLNRSFWRRLATVVGLTGAAVLFAWLLLPPMSYLPQGNQNMVIGVVVPPPGYNPDEFDRIGTTVEAVLRPYWKVRDGESLSEEERWPDWYEGEDPLPGMPNFFFVARGASVFMGARSDDPSNVKPLTALLEHSASTVPGVMMFANQRSLFERGLSSGNAVELEVTGYDQDEIKAAALALMGRISGVLGRPRSEPSNFSLGAPEIQVRLDQTRAAELGLNVRDVGFIVRAMVDGAIVSDYRSEGQTIDVKLLPVAAQGISLDQLDQIPIYTPAKRQLALGSIADIEETQGPTEILHLEEQRAVRLIVESPPGMELSRTMEVLEGEIIGPMRDEGLLPPTISTFLSGTADKLVSTREAMQWNFLLALVITYLLLAALFESFLYPLVILFSVPLAAVGGILGLRIVHHYTGQEMDVLTMLGFVILVGTVVNNAILIVHKGLQNVRDLGMERAEAIVDAVRIRIRPIFMSTSTSVLGMAPLVLFPGAGSELYRGLGSVVIGGLIASTVFTLLVVPTLFSLTLSVQARFGKRFGMPVKSRAAA